MARLNSLNQLVAGRKILEGTWRLAPGHELQYRRRSGREEVLLSGPLAEAGPSGLSFRVEANSLEGELVGRTLQLRGRWQADTRNRLAFLAHRSGGESDLLRLEGEWELDSRHQLLYRFEQEDLKRKRKETHLLRFAGHWDIGEDRQLAYLLDRSSDSSFRFRGAFQTPSILAKEGAIRYQLGAEAEDRGRLRTLTLFGKWKLSRRLGLSFEVPYAGGRIRGIDFGAELGFDSVGNIACRLLTRDGQPLGLEVIFTRQFFKGDGELFARLRRSAEETAVEGGVRVRW